MIIAAGRASAAEKQLRPGDRWARIPPMPPAPRSSWRPLRFVLVALALSWLGWVPLLFHAHGTSVPGGQAWHFFGSLGPLASAFLVVALEHGRPGCHALARTILKWPGRRTFLVALLAPVALLLAGLAASRLLGGEWLDVRGLGTSSEFPGMPPWIYGPAALLFFGFGEEVGWRGYLIPVLQETLKPVHAALVFVPFWAIWHLPLFFGGTNMGTMGAGAIAGWLGSLTVGSVILSWLYNAGRGSVLAAALFHGLLDFVFLLPDPRGVFPSITGALVTVWGIAVLVLPGAWGIRHTPPAARGPVSGPGTTG